jgi:hypothetical protein
LGKLVRKNGGAKEQNLGNTEVVFVCFGKKKLENANFMSLKKESGFYLRT